MQIIKNILYALVLGVATVLGCVILSDGMLQMSSSIVGFISFWLLIIGLPIFARRFVKWRYTLINLPLFYLLYFSIAAYNWSDTHFFFHNGGWISLADWIMALLMSLTLWGLESIVYGIYNAISFFVKKKAATP